MRLADLACAIGARLVDGPADRPIVAVSAHDAAGPSHLIGAFERRWLATALKAPAGAALVADAAAPLHPNTARLVADDPRQAWGQALRLLHPRPSIEPPPVGVHPTAVIDPTAHIDPAARIGPFVQIGARAQIGADARVFAGAYIGADAQIDAGATLHPRAVVFDGCHLAAQSWVGSHAVIGGPGFGLDAQGRVPHVGHVTVGPSAQIGAHSCVDRATVGVTRIGARAFVDNLVQVGHNAQIGDGAVLCGQVGLAGGAIVEAGAIIGGQAGVAGNAVVGAGARVAAQSGVTRPLPGGQTYSGHPAEPNRARLRRLARLKRLLS